MSSVNLPSKEIYIRLGIPMSDRLKISLALNREFKSLEEINNAVVNVNKRLVTCRVSYLYDINVVDVRKWS